MSDVDVSILIKLKEHRCTQPLSGDKSRKDDVSLFCVCYKIKF